VILDKKDYIKNMVTNLKDKAKLQLRKGNANLKNLRTFQEFLVDWKRCSRWKCLHPTNCCCHSNLAWSFKN